MAHEPHQNNLLRLDIDVKMCFTSFSCTAEYNYQLDRIECRSIISMESECGSYRTVCAETTSIRWSIRSLDQGPVPSIIFSSVFVKLHLISQDIKTRYIQTVPYLRFLGDPFLFLSPVPINLNRHIGSRPQVHFPWEDTKHLEIAQPPGGLTSRDRASNHSAQAQVIPAPKPQVPNLSSL